MCLMVWKVIVRKGSWKFLYSHIVVEKVTHEQNKNDIIKIGGKEEKKKL